MKRDTRVEFFNVKLTDAIESPPWGTEHRYAPDHEVWQSTPSFWKPVLGPVVSKKKAVRLIERMLAHHKGPAFYFLVAFEQVGPNGIKLAFLKTESGAEDLIQLSNTRAPMWWWWTHTPEPKPPPPPNRWDLLMGGELY